MPPKPEKDNVKAVVIALTEEQKLAMDCIIVELNRKIGPLRLIVDQLEVQNESLQKTYDEIDQDRSGIIEYLKKTLSWKNRENVEFKEKVKLLEEAREIEMFQIKQIIADLEKNFNTMRDQLSSENRLLAGKLNTMEEFRAIKDDLMEKFEKQEKAFKNQSTKYKELIYNTEKRIVLGKDKLKKEMEGHLLQLTQDFQDATELRIAAATHKVIKGNIFLNNELDTLLSGQARLADQNEKLRESDRSARIAMQSAEEERDAAIQKNIVQLKYMDELTSAYREIIKEKAICDKLNCDFETIHAKIQRLINDNDILSLQIRILEQNLYLGKNDFKKSTINSLTISKECMKIKKILKDLANVIQNALKLDQWSDTDPVREIAERKVILSNLFQLIMQYSEIQPIESIYEQGDLGFIPKQPTKKISVKRISSRESKRSLSLIPDDYSPSKVSASSRSSETQVFAKYSRPSLMTSSESSVKSATSVLSKGVKSGSSSETQPVSGVESNISVTKDVDDSTSQIQEEKEQVEAEILEGQYEEGQYIEEQSDT